MNVGDRIRSALLAMNVTIQWAADNSGIALSSLSKYLCGRSNPGADALLGLHNISLQGRA